MAIITVVIGYLLAWTAVIIDNMNEGYSVVAHEQTPMGLKYVICRALWWDYVTEVGELYVLIYYVVLVVRAFYDSSILEPILRLQKIIIVKSIYFIYSAWS